MNHKELKGSTILVIDDNPTNLNVLSDCLTAHGFTVLLKRDGQKALELLERKNPELILLDIIMPNLDGFETCRKIKEREGVKDIPVIFMTAMSDTESKLKGFELGAVDYITKPFNHEEVLSRVKTHLTIQRLRKNLEIQNNKLEEALVRERKLLEDIRLNLSITLPHELRTPLNAILGYLSCLINAHPHFEPEKIKEQLEIIHDSALRLHRLVENALLYANLKLLKYTPRDLIAAHQERPLNTKPLITSIANYKASAMNRKDDLSLNLADINIRICYKNFEKILLELLDNAFKFSKVGSRVAVETVVSGNLFIINIADNGWGMSRDQISNINAFMQFGRNFQEQQGAGLGLIIARLLTQLEGGMFSIDSELKNGTKVSLVFNREQHLDDFHTPKSDWLDPDDSKLAEDQAQDGQIEPHQISDCLFLDRQAKKPDAGAHKPTLLIVHDNHEERKAIADLLCAWGIEALQAHGCREALNLVAAHRIHLTLIDSGIPLNEGIDIVREIKRAELNPQSKIIAVNSVAGNSISAYDSTIIYDDVLESPLTCQQLLNLFEIHLNVEWLYGEHKQPAAYIAPPEAELRQILDFVSVGHITGIQNQLSYIEQLDSRYYPFVNRLRNLTRGYQINALRDFIQQYLPPEGQ